MTAALTVALLGGAWLVYDDPHVGA
jgi:hypothetical protein